jgi:hypothetical protein
MKYSDYECWIIDGKIILNYKSAGVEVEPVVTQGGNMVDYYRHALRTLNCVQVFYVKSPPCMAGTTAALFAFRRRWVGKVEAVTVSCMASLWWELLDKSWEVQGMPLRFCRAFLGAFAKLRKALLSSWCPSVRLEQLCSHWTDFDEIWCLRFVWKSVEKIQASLKSEKNNRYLTWRRFDIYDNISRNSS